MLRLIIAAGTALLLCGSVRAQVMSGVRYELQPGVHTGVEAARIADELAKLLLAGHYFQLSPAQKTIARSWYVGMNEADDPPWPESTFTLAVVRDIAKQRHIDGVLSVEVLVDLHGKPLSVRTFSSPDQEFSSQAASILMKTRFTPGLCQSSPCNMAFPIAIQVGQTR